MLFQLTLRQKCSATSLDFTMAIHLSVQVVHRHGTKLRQNYGAISQNPSTILARHDILVTRPLVIVILYSTLGLQKFIHALPCL
jgi:hypothetical protein